MQHRLTEAITQTREAIDRIDPHLLARNPIDEDVSLLNGAPERSHYAHVEPALAARLQALGERGTPLSSAYHQLLLLTLILQRADQVEASALPSSIKAWCTKNFVRITDDVVHARQPADFYHHRNDKYLKDLGVCCGRILPAGVQKLNRYDLPVGALRHELPRKLMEVAACLARMGGRGPVYDMHTDSHDADLMAEFSPEGWRRFYLNVADLFAAQPDVRGLYGIGWFFDPQLAQVSPRLNYLRELVLESGGHIFRVGPSEGARTDALSKSATRRELHAAGRYEPTDYMALWDRRALLRWADTAARKAA